MVVQNIKQGICCSRCVSTKISICKILKVLCLNNAVSIIVVEYGHEGSVVGSKHRDGQTLVCKGCGKLRIVVQDAFKYLTNARHRYDVIYMDAFLNPTAETDISGVPLRLKTVNFLKSVQKRLKPGGLVVFNVHLYDDTKETLAAIHSLFPQVYVFEVSHRQSLVVVGSLAKGRERTGDLRLRAKQLDQRFRTTFSFAELLKDLRY